MIVNQFLLSVLAAYILIARIFTDSPDPKDVRCYVDLAINNAGIDVHGSFDTSDIAIVLTGSYGRPDSIHGVLYPRGIYTGISIRDQHLMRPDYFDVEKFPVIRVHSRKIDCISNNRFVGVFDLTIKGITSTITIPFHCTRTTQALTYHARFAINRLDFSLGEPSAILDNTVQIAVKIHIDV